MRNKKPNIVFILTDNLGYGELGVYGGGILRGAPTPRLDKLASEGLRLTNMNMEAQCTPSRSSILTGRFSMRSGTYAVPLGGVPEGLTQWEITIAQSLSNEGYATGMWGKWHLGSQDGRLPNDRGFDEWYGIPRTTDEARWPSSPGYSPQIVPMQKIMEGKKGEKSRAMKDYDLEQRRLMDAEITKRSVAFIERQAKTGKPFFAYLALTQPHLPTLPNPAFAGKTGNGDWADMLAEMDYNVGQVLDAVDAAGIRDNTICHLHQRQRRGILQALERLGRPMARQVCHRARRRSSCAVHCALAREDSGWPHQQRDRARSRYVRDPRQVHRRQGARRPAHRQPGSV